MKESGVEVPKCIEINKPLLINVQAKEQLRRNSTMVWNNKKTIQLYRKLWNTADAGLTEKLVALQVCFTKV